VARPGAGKPQNAQVTAYLLGGLEESSAQDDDRGLAYSGDVGARVALVDDEIAEIRWET
jgi:hypothetical protein